jgi:hypothetical protein
VHVYTFRLEFFFVSFYFSFLFISYFPYGPYKYVVRFMVYLRCLIAYIDGGSDLVPCHFSEFVMQTMICMAGQPVRALNADLPEYESLYCVQHIAYNVGNGTISSRIRDLRD